MSERVLVIKLGAFGDVLQAEGALHDIREYHPGARITALTTPPYRRLLERCPWVDEVALDPRAPRWRIDRMQALRQAVGFDDFDVIYDLQNVARTGTYRRWLARGVRWVGDVDPEERDTVPSLERLRRQLDAAGVPTHHTLAPDLGWMANDVDHLLTEAGVDRPFVLLITGASARNPHKAWPHYHELAGRLLDRGIAVVTAPGPDELARGHDVPGIVLTGPGAYLDYFDLAGVIRAAAFVIGNDTGPSHMAAHLGTPGLALFGPHASARMTSIERERFQAIEVPDLAQLGVDRVVAEWSRHWNPLEESA